MSKKKSSKKSSKKPQQMKIAGTGRIDGIPEIEAQAEKYRAKLTERMELQEEEIKEQDTLTDLLKQHGFADGKEYVYIDEDNVKRRVYIPTKDEGRAKVRAVKEKTGSPSESDE